MYTLQRIQKYHENPALAVDGKKRLDDFRAYMMRLSIKTINEPLTKEHPRMIFSSDKHVFNLLNSECNGLIIDLKTLNPLVIPARQCVKSIRREHVKDVNLFVQKGLYDFYEIMDGTVINLYYFDNEWKISTKNGYDMNYMLWNDVAYIDTLSMVVEKYGMDLKTFYASLDINQCYTFGFKHHIHHPFNEGGEPIIKLWFIQSVLLHPPFTVNKTVSPIKNVPIQLPVAAKRNIYDVFREMKRALKNFKSSKKICYGYILRSRDESITRELSHLMLESNLLSQIEAIVYNYDVNKQIIESKLLRMEFIIIRALLNPLLRESLFLLFPEHIHIIEKVLDIKVKLTEAIMECHKTGDVEETTLSHSIAKIILPNIYTYFKFNSEEPITKEKIESLITSEIYIKHYYNLYISDLDL